MMGVTASLGLAIESVVRRASDVSIAGRAAGGFAAGEVCDLVPGAGGEAGFCAVLATGFVTAAVGGVGTLAAAADGCVTPGVAAAGGFTTGDCGPLGEAASRGRLAVVGAGFGTAGGGGLGPERPAVELRGSLGGELGVPVPDGALDGTDGGLIGGPVGGVFGAAAFIGDGESVGRFVAGRSIVGAPPSATVSVKTLGPEGLPMPGRASDPPRTRSAGRSLGDDGPPVDPRSGRGAVAVAAGVAGEVAARLPDEGDAFRAAASLRLLPPSDGGPPRPAEKAATVWSVVETGGWVASQARSSSATACADSTRRSRFFWVIRRTKSTSSRGQSGRSIRMSAGCCV